MLSKSLRFKMGVKLPTKSIHTPFFSIRHEKADSLKVAVVVSRKVDARATKRNYLKRILHEMLFTIDKDKKISQVLVVYLKKPIVGIKPESIKQELLKTLETIQHANI